MTQIFVIFSIGVVGALVRLSADFVLKLLARKARSETIVAGPYRDVPAQAAPHFDPVAKVGFILTCYGAIVLALVSALPGTLALERTVLAFGLLCIGGLIGEISSTSNSTSSPVRSSREEGESEAEVLQRPLSRRLAVALTVVLNAGVALLGAQQRLIEIVPTKTLHAAYQQELEPLIVVARRSQGSLDADALSYGNSGTSR